MESVFFVLDFTLVNGCIRKLGLNKKLLTCLLNQLSNLNS